MRARVHHAAVVDNLSPASQIEPMAEADSPADRLALALDLHDAGVLMMREKLRRDMPDASEDAIDAAVAKWLGHRPGARDGDGVGVARPWPRVR